jgi:nucleotide-binding universal stress UspA family protein
VQATLHRLNTTGEHTVILIAYDGSVDAQAAIEDAGRLLNGQPTTILTVWERFIEVLARAGTGMPLGPLDYEALDRSSEEQARQKAAEGAQLAEQAGLNAQPSIRARVTSVADCILAEADDLGADAIVMGTRGLTGVKSFLLGSVSHAVLQRSGRPVIVVPSPDVAAERAARRP